MAGTSPEAISAEGCRQRTHLHHQGRILGLQGFRPFDDQAEGRLVTEIGKMVALHSPMTWAYIDLLGEYDLTQDRLQDNTGVLPPKTEYRIIPEIWEPPNR
ncbi:MAG: DUF4158 domain-containing protein [Boseongicola sp. SB0673_bin_14]|nr:DUF4158 domain-containing protein [Boseongicola sp. SB0673_bin_14]